MRIEIKELYKQHASLLDQDVEVVGWIRTVRNSKNYGFIAINDGSFFKPLQIVFDAETQCDQAIESLPIGTALAVTGKLVASPGAEQPCEVKAKKIVIMAMSNADFPLQKKQHTFEFLRTIAHLRPRSNTFTAVFRVRSLLSQAIHTFFQDRGFVNVHTPIISSSDCEGAGEMFRVTTLDLKKAPTKEDGSIDFSQDFFGRETGLTVSGQLEGEAMAMAFGKIYTFGPTFRAENSNTKRHAAEFWMIEPEVAFADLKSNMQLAEDMLKYIIKYVLERAPEEMKFFNKFIDEGLLERLEHVANSDFGRVTYTEAIDILQKSGEKFEYEVAWGKELQTEHERYLAEKVYKKPVFVTDYPKEFKAFYMRLSDDKKTVAAMDLLVPGIGEIIGGSQREERQEILESRMRDVNLKPEDYWWYLDLRKYGGVQHAGFGLGFERAVMYITGMDNIRDVIPFPRTPKSADF